jgi:hypothetical protein
MLASSLWLQSGQVRALHRHTNLEVMIQEGKPIKPYSLRQVQQGLPHAASMRAWAQVLARSALQMHARPGGCSAVSCACEEIYICLIRDRTLTSSRASTGGFVRVFH